MILSLTLSYWRNSTRKEIKLKRNRWIYKVNPLCIIQIIVHSGYSKESQSVQMQIWKQGYYQQRTKRKVSGMTSFTQILWQNQLFLIRTHNCARLTNTIRINTPNLAESRCNINSLWTRNRNQQHEATQSTFTSGKINFGILNLRNLKHFKLCYTGVFDFDHLWRACW